MIAYRAGRGFGMAGRSRTGAVSVNTTDVRRRTAAGYIEAGAAPIPVPDGQKEAVPG